jgi:demethylmenaquinone methyltransferase/2-methoxy-6-polyprenyl-1,4-benzoquinol methylase
VSSYVFMKALESTARRYDRGMRLLSRGRIATVYTALAELAATSTRRVLDLGCGTGGVALACAARGAAVVGIDINADMLEVARSKPLPFGGGTVEWAQLGIAEIEDQFSPASFDAVTACLVFSELSKDEREYALCQILTFLAPGGVLVIADEVPPRGALGRFLHGATRLPFVVVTWLLTQTTTRPVTGLVDLARGVGFVEVEEKRLLGLTIVTGRRPLEAA